MQNRLADAPSPYLQQHATNPVAWQPWDEEALDAARASGKPILLSIGYASCHWCHVMAHESFEDEATAAVMNEHFVNIKVDREERPDLDKVYQLAHQLLTQNSGGWPLTMFLDPETRLPFFGGTYFPKTAQYGLPAFVDLLRRISTVFAEQRDALGEQGAKISDVLARIAPTPTDAALEDTALLQAARDALASQYDERHHGFGSAPKFPMPTTVERLLRHWAYGQRQGERDRKALDMVMLTLTALSRGGCYDHLGGGFYRYSVDREWQVPHFEKMLYDNGLLLELFADALSIGPDALFDGAARDTAAWLLREMRAPGGAFYAALDADSEGEEGRYYVWRREQVKRLLSEDEYLLIEPSTARQAGQLRKQVEPPTLRQLAQRRAAAEPGRAGGQQAACICTGQALRCPFGAAAPGLDAKVLTAWNGLAIAGLCRAGTVLNEPEWIDAAEAATDFLRRNCWQDGVLYATWQDGQPLHQGYLDDYAFLLHAVLLLLRVRWRGELVTFARALADAAIERFEDPEHGGFFFTANDHEALIHRPKPTQDDAQPPGNGVLCRSLIELGHLFAEPRYLEAAERTLKWARGAMEQQPASHCSLLSALEDFSQPPETVILRGPAELIASWRAAIDVGYRPWRLVYAVPYDDAATAPALPAAAGER